MDALEQFGVWWITLCFGLDLQVPQRVLNLLDLLTLRVYQYLCTTPTV